MKSVYPVLFTETEKGFLIEVPDFEILTQGSDLYDAIKMARDAIELNCVSFEDSNKKIPNPSKMGALNIKDCAFAADGNTFVSLVDIDSTRYRRMLDEKV